MTFRGESSLNDVFSLTLSSLTDFPNLFCAQSGGLNLSYLSGVIGSL